MNSSCFHRLLVLIFVLLPGSQCASRVCAESPVAGEAGIDFDRQIHGILKLRCAQCHGEEAKESGFSVRTGQELLKGGDTGAAVTAGLPEQSLMIQMIRDGQMPPKGNEPLTPEEINLLERWITQGAKISGGGSTVAAVTSEQIVPLMLLRCSACHGGRRTEAGLDLRTREGILRGGKSGPAAIPGNPSESLMVRRVHAEEMPPRRLLVSVSVKPMESTELKLLETWIATGMPEPEQKAVSSDSDTDSDVSAEDRQFWSFQPPKAIAPPVSQLSAAGQSLVRNGIDAFILQRLEDKGLTLAGDADRATLIRRLSFDLIGLPPAPEEVRAFVNDHDPRAWENLVDRLLDSPHYGERWARHWLDVAGYADSEGSQNEDRIRPNMWRYRDYVIRSFNADKPYDRFIQEQLAGDELADYQNSSEITDEMYQNIVATGFLRTAPDRTFANITNFVPDRLEVIADEVQILGSAVIGLTLHCARCHAHKFDPISQKDYYRLTASLKDALDEHDWIGPETRALNSVTTEERRAWEAAEKEIDARVNSQKEKLASASDDAEKKSIEEQIQTIERERRPEPQIRALWSRGDPSPSFILRRGNYLTPGPEVFPGVPAVLTSGSPLLKPEPPWPGAKTTGRRLALAQWLTTPDHPLTSRVMVNRLWKHHFGRGLVTTLSNFGKTGARPTHPELLDWLATEFVRGGWSLKQMHRLMVKSATYRQTSTITETMLQADPDNVLWSRMPMRRLEAEAVRDSLLIVAGKLDTRAFGPPDQIDVRDDGLVTPQQSDRGGRRSIYVLHRRTKMPTILESFDSPQMGPNCTERGESIVAPQALHLLNNKAVHELAEAFAARVINEAETDSQARVIRVHELATGSSPSAEALKTGMESLQKLTAAWREYQKESLKQDAATAPADPDIMAEKSALQSYCHAIMNSAAFVYVD